MQFVSAWKDKNDLAATDSFDRKFYIGAGSMGIDRGHQAQHIQMFKQSKQFLGVSSCWIAAGVAVVFELLSRRAQE